MEDPVSTPLATSAAEQPKPRGSGYYELLSYIVSNTISGEIVAVENYSEMVSLMPSQEAAIEANHQAWEECGHIRQLAKLGSRLGFSVEQRIVEPQWEKIRQHFSRAVKRRDLAACLLIHDVMTETFAILLYRTLSKEADADPVTASVAARILRDEEAHLEIGIRRLRALRAKNETEVEDALVWAHHRVMPELFGMVSTSCHYLCDRLNLDCASLDLGELGLEIDSLRVEALQAYMESLDRVGFPPSVTNPLIAGMTAYEGMQDVVVGGPAKCSGPSCC